MPNWREISGQNFSRRAKLARDNHGIITATVAYDAERWSIENWNGEQRNSLRLPTLFRAIGYRRQIRGKVIGLQTMQKIRPSSEDNNFPDYCSADHSTVSGSTTESPTTNKCCINHHPIDFSTASSYFKGACGTTADQGTAECTAIGKSNANSHRTGYTAASSSTDYTIINYRSDTGIIDCEAIRVSGSQHQPDTRRAKAATKGKPIATN